MKVRREILDKFDWGYFFFFAWTNHEKVIKRR